MSYEILYGRQFIDLQNGTYIPMILSGSNNCTFFRDGREMLERHWWPYLSQPAMTRNEMIEYANKMTRDYDHSEWFMRSGKWMFTSDILHWMESGIKSARTIEELAMHSYPLSCSILVYDKTRSYGERGYCREEMFNTIRTTEALNEWIAEYEKRKKSIKPTEYIEPKMLFSTYKPLGLGVKPASGAPVICKFDEEYLEGYLCEYSKNGYGASPDRHRAIVFESAEDFSAKTAGFKFGRYHLVPAPKPQEEKPFVIRVAAGGYAGQYVERLTRSRLRLTSSAKYARRFLSEREARRYIEDKLIGRFGSGWEVVKIAPEKEVKL